MNGQKCGPPAGATSNVSQLDQKATKKLQGFKKTCRLFQIPANQIPGIG